MNKHVKIAIPLLVGIIIWLIPVPSGLTPNAWYYFAIFVAGILALMFEVLPGAVCGLIVVGLAATLSLVPPSPPPAPAPSPAAKVVSSADAPKADMKAAKPENSPSTQANPNVTPKPQTAAPATKKPSPTDEIKWALSGFSNLNVWLIFAAFTFAAGYEKTGLGRRIALLMVKMLGRSTLGLGYAVTCADLALAPFLPSQTARSGGTIFPIVSNIPLLYGSTPENDPRKIGSYLMWINVVAGTITSVAFLTASAPNLLAVTMAEKITGFSIGWTDWFIYMLPVSVVLLLTIPYLVYLIYPPELKSSPEAPAWAAEQLKELGPMRAKEITMALLALVALLMWIFGGKYMNPTLVALVLISVMVPTKVVSWDDILGNKAAWNILLWYGTLLSIAEGLERVGFLHWFCQNLAASISGYDVTIVIILMIASFWYASYFFASISGMTTALLPPYLMAALLVPGLPLKAFTMIACGSLMLRGALAPYCLPSGIIVFGTGYIKSTTFWRLGFIFSTICLIALLGLEIPYLYMLLGK